MNRLQKWRTDIGHIDEQLIELIARRLDLAEKIGLEKRRANSPIRDWSVEKDGYRPGPPMRRTAAGTGRSGHRHHGAINRGVLRSAGEAAPGEKRKIFRPDPGCRRQRENGSVVRPLLS